MLQVHVKQLHDANREALSLAWVAGQDSDASIHRDAAASAALIGHLNLNHPNRIQVLGAWESPLLTGGESATRAEVVARLLSFTPTAVVLADGVSPTPELVEGAQRTRTPLMTSPAPAARVIEKLGRYLSKVLADSIERHGVCMDVLGLGVLITGDSGVGKSELGLELISRGHGLVADDVVEISLIAENTLEARCPALLRDFLEVRGLGLLNIRTIFGETAVRPKMRLRLVAHLERPSKGTPAPAERLPLSELSEEILGTTLRKVIIPVAAGRNLAVLLEAAVRNYILLLRGVDSMAEFMERQRRAIEKDV